MALNLSLYDGIPTTLKIAKEQYRSHIKNPRSYGIFPDQKGYLVLMKLTKGKYKGYWSTFWYYTKPKKNENIIKIWKIK